MAAYESGDDGTLLKNRGDAIRETVRKHPGAGGFSLELEYVEYDHGDQGATIMVKDGGDYIADIWFGVGPDYVDVHCYDRKYEEILKDISKELGAGEFWVFEDDEDYEG